MDRREFVRLGGPFLGALVAACATVQPLPTTRPGPVRRLIRRRREKRKDRREQLSAADYQMVVDGKIVDLRKGP
jgi:hypothetical protein